MSFATTRIARIATLAALVFVFSTTLSANRLSVTGYASDGTDPRGAKLVLWATTNQYPVIQTQFTEVYPFIDGRAIQDNENDAWHSMTMMYDAAYDQHWTISVPTTNGWHSVQYLARTADGRWVWDTTTDWILVGG